MLNDKENPYFPYHNCGHKGCLPENRTAGNVYCGVTKIYLEGEWEMTQQVQILRTEDLQALRADLKHCSINRQEARVVGFSKPHDDCKFYHLIVMAKTEWFDELLEVKPENLDSIVTPAAVTINNPGQTRPTLYQWLYDEREKEIKEFKTAEKEDAAQGQ